MRRGRPRRRRRPRFHLPRGSPSRRPPWPDDRLQRPDSCGLLPYPPTVASAARVLPCAACGDDGAHRRGGRMALTKEAKLDIITKYGRDEHDTGSPQVQIAMLTQRINELTEHLRTHRHDYYSRRGLLKLVGRRRRFLNYLQKHDLEGYRALIKELGIRR